MKSYVIGVDIDGVIVDLGTAILPLLSEVCDRPLAYQDLCSWDLCEALCISKELMNNAWKRIFNSDALRHAPPICGAINGLSELSKHEIWLITSRPLLTQDLTISWLRDNRVHYDQIVFNRRGNKFSTGPIFNIFIEDFLDEARILSKAGIFTILFDQPWNKSPKLPDNCQRAYSWDDVLQLINDL